MCMGILVCKQGKIHTIGNAKFLKKNLCGYIFFELTNAEYIYLYTNIRSQGDVYFNSEGTSLEDKFEFC